MNPEIKKIIKQMFKSNYLNYWEYKALLALCEEYEGMRDLVSIFGEETSEFERFHTLEDIKKEIIMLLCENYFYHKGKV